MLLLFNSLHAVFPAHPIEELLRGPVQAAATAGRSCCVPRRVDDRVDTPARRPQVAAGALHVELFALGSRLERNVAHEYAVEQGANHATAGKTYDVS